MKSLIRKNIIKKTKILNILVLISAIIIFSLCAELVLRGINPNLQITKLPWDKHKVMDKGDKSKSYIINTTEFYYNVTLNKEGFKDVDHQIEKNMFRIIGLGDSFTWGIGASYEETYLRVLEKNLQIVEIIKMGIPSYYPKLEINVLLNKGLKYHPDLLLLLTLPGDLIDTCMDKTLRVIPDFFKYLITKSYFARFIYVKTINMKKTACKNLKSEKTWSKLYKDLEEIKKITDKNGIKMVIITITKEVTHLDYNNKIEKFAISKNITVLNLGEKFSSKEEELHWPIDGHLKPEGYNFLAEEVGKFIVEKDLIAQK